jgi:hypothetical protein
MDLATLDSLDRETLIRLILSQPEIIERIEGWLIASQPLHEFQ